MNTRAVIAPVVLAAVAATQIVLALRADLTPWKGGGFGMFATLDHGAFRGVDVIIEAPGRSEQLEIPPSLELLAAKVASFPSDALLERLARAVAEREKRHSRPATRVLVSVWRTDFSADTLLATERTLRRLALDVP